MVGYARQSDASLPEPNGTNVELLSDEHVEPDRGGRPDGASLPRPHAGGGV